MTENLLAIPRRTGGSRFGWSFLSTFAECETRWFNSHLRPLLHLDEDTGHETLTLGIRPRAYAPALDIGIRVHAGLEAWLRSGWDGSLGLDTGARSLDAAIAAHDHAPAEGFATDELADSIATTDRLLRLYHETYGPAGHQPDYPRKRTAKMKNGRPGIEAELGLDVGYGGYTFTARLDYVYKLDDYVFADEHKTASARTVAGTLARAHLDGQFTGQNLLLATHFPSEPIGGVTCDALVKDRGKSERPALIRQDTSRTPAQLEKFKLDMARRLDRIENSVGNYRTLLEGGMKADDAARVTFDQSPDGHRCVDAFGFRCDFYDLCANRDESEQLARAHFAPREYVGEYQNPFAPRPAPTGETTSALVSEHPKVLEIISTPPQETA